MTSDHRNIGNRSPFSFFFFFFSPPCTDLPPPFCFSSCLSFLPFLFFYLISFLFLLPIPFSSLFSFLLVFLLFSFFSFSFLSTEFFFFFFWFVPTRGNFLSLSYFPCVLHMLHLPSDMCHMETCTKCQMPHHMALMQCALLQACHVAPHGSHVNYRFAIFQKNCIFLRFYS